MGFSLIQEMEGGNGGKPPMDHIHPSPRQNTRKGTNNSSQPRGWKLGNDVGVLLKM